MKVAIIDGLVVVILFCVVVRAEMATHELQCDGQDNCVIGSKTEGDNVLKVASMACATYPCKSPNSLIILTEKRDNDNSYLFECALESNQEKVDCAKIAPIAHQTLVDLVLQNRELPFETLNYGKKKRQLPFETLNYGKRNCDCSGSSWSAAKRTLPFDPVLMGKRNLPFETLNYGKRASAYIPVDGYIMGKRGDD